MFGTLGVLTGLACTATLGVVAVVTGLVSIPVLSTLLALKDVAAPRTGR